MDRSAKSIARSLAILMLAAFLTPAVGQFAIRAVKSNRNDMSEWLPASYEETKQLQWFRSRFVADQFIVISWEGCTLGDAPNGLGDDPRIERLAKALRTVRMPSTDDQPGPLCFQKVQTGRDLLSEMTEGASQLRLKTAKERLSGTLIGPDGKQTCVIATLADTKEHRLRDLIGRPLPGPLGLRKAKVTPLYDALAQANIAPEQVRLGGPPVENVSIDEEGERTLVRLALLSGIFGAALAWWSLRSLRMTIIVFGCGIASAAISLAIVPLTGGSVDAILMSMPALVYVLAVSGAIHFINYYRHEYADHGIEGAVAGATRHAWRPALLCSVTTAIGLASLATSDIIPIWRFGVYSATGVMATLGVVFLILPATMHCWPWKPSGTHSDDLAGESGDPFAKIWPRYTGAIERHKWLVMAGSSAVIVFLCAGLPRVTTSIDLLKLFSSDAQLVQDYQWMETHMGRLVPMELVVRFPKDSLQEELPDDAPLAQLIHTHSFLQRWALVELVEKNIQRRLGAAGDDLVGASMSAATFIRPVGKGGGGAAEMMQGYVATRELLAHRDQLAKSGFLYVDPQSGEELWRISVRVAAFHNVDHSELISRMRKAVEPIFTAERSNVAALRSLAAERGQLPKGSRLVLFSPGGIDDWARSSAALLSGKNMGAKPLVKSATDLQPADIELLKQSDGVVLGVHATTEDQKRLAAAGAKIIAVADHRTAPDDGADVGVVYTGAVPIIYKAQRALLDSLIDSTWWSFATITPLMMWICRSIAAGALVMVPNTLPVLVVFGGMGWLGVPVDIGSMMAASIALGVAVDDTIHFLAWFREDIAKLGDRAAAVQAAYRRSGTPTLQSALINGLGLSVFATSSFTPTQRFGWLMLAILIAGVVAELVVLPAILFSPLGGVFKQPSLKVHYADEESDAA